MALCFTLFGNIKTCWSVLGGFHLLVVVISIALRLYSACKLLWSSIVSFHNFYPVGLPSSNFLFLSIFYFLIIYLLLSRLLHVSRQNGDCSVAEVVTREVLINRLILVICSHSSSCSTSNRAINTFMVVSLLQCVFQVMYWKFMTWAMADCAIPSWERRLLVTALVWTQRE